MGSDWETLKRFNLAELYQKPSNAATPSVPEAKLQRVKEGDADVVPSVTSNLGP